MSSSGQTVFSVVSRKDLFRIPQTATSLNVFSQNQNILQTAEDCDLLPFTRLEGLFLIGDVGEEAEKQMFKEIYESSTLKELDLEDLNKGLSCFKLLIAGKVSNVLTELKLRLIG